MGKRRRRKSIVPNMPITSAVSNKRAPAQNPSPTKETLEDWDSRIRREGPQLAEELRKKGEKFNVKTLASQKKVNGGDTVHLSGVTIGLDWKIAAKHELVEIATEFISKADIIDSLDPALPSILKSAIEGKGLYQYGIGEFFLLYGRFEQKYQVSRWDARQKMVKMANGKAKSFKQVKDRNGPRLDPLPYAVKNILSHIGNSPDTLDTEELRNSIDLLKGWV